MVGQAQLDLELLFGRSGAEFTVRVVRSPAGDGQTATFGLPIDQLELENFALKIGRQRIRTRRQEDLPVAAAKSLGGRLFRAVFDGAVRECLRRSIDRAAAAGVPLRIRLRLTDCPELTDLPWELLYDQDDNWFLALSGSTPVVRYMHLPVQPRPIPVNLPLRVLAIRSEPYGYPQLDLAAEWEQVSEALADLIGSGALAVTELADPTPGELRKILLRDQFHVLHYMGHGGFNERDGGTLVFTGHARQAVPVTGESLGILLRDHASLRLAILNACEAARSDPADPFAGVADTLVRRGIPAVIAMQFEISDRAAIEFAPALYGALAAGRPIDTALAEARKAIYTVSPIEWVTPVLYLRADDARLFDITPAREHPPSSISLARGTPEGHIGSANLPPEDAIAEARYPQPIDPDRPPETISADPRTLGGRYQVDSLLLARGGIADVYRAHDLRLDRIVAVKALREDLAERNAIRTIFLRQAELQKSLDHPSFAAIYDVGEDDSTRSYRPFIVMEFVDGRSINSLLHDADGLGPERALNLIDAVLVALDYLHQMGIVHCNIAPSNVMLNRHGEIKMIGFSVARYAVEAPLRTEYENEVIGTAEYMSPEQARHERVDARSDLYAAGCMLYEMLTRRRPFTGDSPIAIAYQHVREDPVPPSRLDESLPSWADAITLRALRKDPSERYQTASEMQRDVRRSLSGLPVAAAQSNNVPLRGAEAEAPAAHDFGHADVNVGSRQVSAYSAFAPPRGLRYLFSLIASIIGGVLWVLGLPWWVPVIFVVVALGVPVSGWLMLD